MGLDWGNGGEVGRLDALAIRLRRIDCQWLWIAESSWVLREALNEWCWCKRAVMGVWRNAGKWQRTDWDMGNSRSSCISGCLVDLNLYRVSIKPKCWYIAVALVLGCVVEGMWSWVDGGVVVELWSAGTKYAAGTVPTDAQITRATAE